MEWRPPKLSGSVCAYHPAAQGFESHVHHRHFEFFKLYLYCNLKRTKINKRGRDWHIFWKNVFLGSQTVAVKTIFAHFSLDLWGLLERPHWMAQFRSSVSHVCYIILCAINPILGKWKAKKKYQFFCRDLYESDSMHETWSRCHKQISAFA